MEEQSSGAKMVAIIGGNHLGLSLNSLGVLGKSEGGQARSGGSGERVYVNVSTGNLVVQDADEQLVGRGGAYQTLRTYNSQGRWIDAGLNWSIHGARRMLVLEGSWGRPDSGVVRLERDGARARYDWDAQRQSYVSTDGGGAYRRIVREEDYYVWRDGRNATISKADIPLQADSMLIYHTHPSAFLNA